MLAILLVEFLPNHASFLAQPQIPSELEIFFKSLQVSPTSQNKMTQGRLISVQLTEDCPELPLPDPYPEYLVCPYCGEPEVEVWCYELTARCHQCGQIIEKPRPGCFGQSPLCRQDEK